MSAVTDTELLQHASNAKGKVVIITGGANGLGKEAGKMFAQAGAKVVIGDLDMVAAAKTVDEFKQLGGDAVAQKADVTNWDDQVSLFALAISTYGVIDVVVANAGVAEIGQFEVVGDAGNKEPRRPKLKTLDINTNGLLYTSRLAIFHFKKNPNQNKTLILIGSLASITGIPLAPYYTVTKHSVLGISRSLTASATPDIRIAMVNPWFADTAILGSEIRFLLRGLDFVSTPRVGASILHAATDPSYNAVHGSAYALPDGGEVWRIPRGLLDNSAGEQGVEMYEALRRRIGDQVENPKGPMTQA